MVRAGSRRADVECEDAQPQHLHPVVPPAACYRLCLPTDEQLRAEIEEQKRIFMAQQEERAALPEGAGE